MPTPVAITGLGAVSVFGDSVAQFRDGLLGGQTGITPVTRFPVETCRARTAAEVRGFDPAQWIPPMKLRRLDPTCALAIAAAEQAIDEAGIAPAEDGDDRMGVVLGTWSAGGATTSEFLQSLFAHGPQGAPALLFSSTVGNTAASQTAIELRLRGPNVTVSQKEASGLAAVAMAAGLIRSGRADRMVTGGVDSIFDIFFRVHDRFGVLASGTEPSRPFDAASAGFVLGEGGFALLLDAGAPARRGAILGAGLGGIATPVNAWPDEPAALVTTMQAALDEAGIRAADVDVVYASANGAMSLDEVEAAALDTLFGGSRTIVTSVKGAVGECGAASAAALVAALACGAAGGVPPIVGLRAPSAAARSLRLATTRLDVPGPIALVNGVASGGSLAAVVVRTTAD